MTAQVLNIQTHRCVYVTGQRIRQRRMHERLRQELILAAMERELEAAFDEMIRNDPEFCRDGGLAL